MGTPGPPGSAGAPGTPGALGAIGPTGATGPAGGTPTLVSDHATSDGLDNGDTLVASARCVGSVVGGGYTIDTPGRPQDQNKLTPIASFPADAQTWTVVIAASANVEIVVLTVLATCTP